MKLYAPARATLVLFALIIYASVFSSPVSAGMGLPDSFQMTVSGDGQNLTAQFDRFSTRGPNFQVVVQQGNGSLMAATPGEVPTYLGTIDEDAGAVATAVRFPDGTVYYHVIFENGDNWVNEGGNTTVFDDPAGGRPWPHLVPEPGGAGNVILAAELGVDLPYHRFDGVHNSDVNLALTTIEFSVMSGNLVYLREAGLTHRLGRVVLRGNQAQDPYAPLRGAPSPGCQGSVLEQHCDFLNMLKNQWDNVLPASTHDIALVVNEEGASGLAFLGQIGDPRGYSSNDASALGDFSRPWRHEAGHNWFLSHFDGGAPGGSTMNSGNSLATLSGPEQALMTGFRDQKLVHLDDIGPLLPLDMPPRAATDSAYVPASATSVDIDVLANDHDANGDTLTLISATTNPTSGTLGGTMAVVPGAGPMGRDILRYTPPVVTTPQTDIDVFEYRIRDSFGFDGVGRVFVRMVDFGDSYSQDFNAFADGTTDFGDGSFISQLEEQGVSSVQGQALELVTDQAGRFANLTIPLQRLTSGFTVTFRYRLTAAGTPADGFGLNFGDPIANRGGQGAVRFARGLTVEFSTFANPGIEILIDGNGIPGAFVPDNGLVDGLWHDVTVTWQEQGRITLNIDNNDVFTDLSTAGFAPTAADMLAFAARNGGLSERVQIDDIVVNVPLRPIFKDGFEQ